MQNRQIDGHGLYLSLLAGLAVLCLAAALVWFARPQPETAAPRYPLKDQRRARSAVHRRRHRPAGDLRRPFTPAFCPESDVS